MDNSSWKLNDPIWLRERQRKWPTFKKWINKYNLSLADKEPKEYHRLAKMFYDGEVRLDKTKLRLNEYFVLHPSLNVDAARELIDYIDKQHPGAYSGFFGHYYALDELFGSLISTSTIESNIIHTIVKAFYDDNYLKASKLRNFKIDEEAGDTLSKLFELTAKWIVSADRPYYPAEQLLPFFLGAMEVLNTFQLEYCEFEVKMFVKFCKQVPRKHQGLDQKKFLKEFKRLVKQRRKNIIPQLTSILDDLPE